jgi:hypothetical protein
MWLKKGLLFNVIQFKRNEINSHASIPFAFNIGEDIYRIYFSSRNELGQSLPYCIEAEVSNGTINFISDVSSQILPLGELGTFDDSGIMPSSLVSHNGLVYMYYIGWNPQVTVSYRLSIGLAISKDNGVTFEKVSNGPICERSLEEPYFNTAPYVIVENGIWRMWYISCTKWDIINGYPEPSYHVKYAESKDGINFVRKNIICIDYDDLAKAIGRPCVIFNNDKYEMYFSYRDIVDYRTDRGKGYQIGKALSHDGLTWEKQYSEAGIKLSDNGWDSKMIEYCHVFNHGDFSYMIYNGNEFGKDGFGYASRQR